MCSYMYASDRITSLPFGSLARTPLPTLDPMVVDGYDSCMEVVMADDVYEIRIRASKSYFANKDKFIQFVRDYASGNSRCFVKIIVDGIAEYDPALAKIYNKFTDVHEELYAYCRSKLEGK